MKLLIKNGYIIDPISKLEGIRDILIEDACIRITSYNVCYTKLLRDQWGNHPKFPGH